MNTYNVTFQDTDEPQVYTDLSRKQVLCLIEEEPSRYSVAEYDPVEDETVERLNGEEWISQNCKTEYVLK